jgi:hypothetical protein
MRSKKFHDDESETYRVMMIWLSIYLAIAIGLLVFFTVFHEQTFTFIMNTCYTIVSWWE